MSLTQMNTGPAPVTVTGHTVTIHELAITHPEAATFLQEQARQHGPSAVADAVRRALPIGLVALSLGTAAMDTGNLTRTLDAFASKVDAKSTAALASLDQTLERLKAGEATVADTATSVLRSLPAQVEAALAGQAGSVRANVAEATRAVQAAGMDELTTALARHSESVRDALSLDREGPVRMLRKDLLEELNGTRREIGEQLALVRSLVEAAQVAKTAGAKSSRAVGDDWEATAMAMAESVVTAAGDFFEATGSQAGPGTTRRVGDGVAILGPALTGTGPRPRICLEAKARSRPMGHAALRRELTQAREVRDAVAGIILVRTPEEVPGNSRICRIDELGFVIAGDDRETVELAYLVTRELAAAAHLHRHGDDEVDLAQVQLRLASALEALNDFDEVGKLAVTAGKQLEKLREVGRRSQLRIREALTESVKLINT